MQMQRVEVDKLREWMTKTEDKISLIGNQRLSLSDVQNQLREHEKLKQDFEVHSNILMKRPVETGLIT